MSGGLFDDLDEGPGHARDLVVDDRQPIRPPPPQREHKPARKSVAPVLPSAALPEHAERTRKLLEAVKLTLLRVRNHVKPGSGGLPDWLLTECMDSIIKIDKALAPAIDEKIKENGVRSPSGDTR